MKKRKNRPVTARELMARLSKDPQWVAKNAERQKRMDDLDRELSGNEAPLLQELAASGFRLQSVYDLVNTSTSYKEAIPILVNHLERGEKYHPRIREGIARALTVPEARSVVPRLLEAFRRDPDTSLNGPKWALGNAIEALASEAYIDEIVDLALDEKNGQARSELVTRLGASRSPAARSAIEKLVNDPCKEVALTAQGILAEK